MKEYIEREILQKAINTEISEHAEDAKKSLYECGYNNGLTMAYALLLKAPAADVVEVRHGRWERIIPTKSAAKWSTKVSCSQCHRQGYERYNYCPHCGCKMDKEK